MCLSIPALLAQNWNSQLPTLSPSPRDGAAMVYDPVHHQTLLFGGEDNTGTILADTWVYNGTNWTHLQPATSPTPRLWHGMAFDAAHGTIVLFGGCPNTTCSPAYLGDTWLWNGTTWALQTGLEQSPGPRLSPAMAYSGTTTNSGVVLFGGSSAPNTALQDMWIWNGTAWYTPEVQPATARVCASMSYDTSTQELIMFGGDNGTTLLNDIWRFNGTTWSSPNPAQPLPLPRSTQGQVYDPVRQVSVVFGGGGLSDTWLWNDRAGTWTNETTTNTPAGRFYVNLAYDIQNSDAVLFGGQATTGVSSSDLADTWTLGIMYNPGWMLYGAGAYPSGPAAGMNASVTTYGSYVAVFGGATTSTVSNSFWLWTGDYYASPSASPPPGRHSAPMAVDSNGNLVLFGGDSAPISATPAPLGDTWLYNGFNWNSVGGTGPSSRRASAMAYDAATQQTVLFGGYDGTNYFKETWIWNGANWTMATPVHMPSPRAYASMTYDVKTGNVLLYGGVSGTVTLADTWVWNGTDWTPLTPAGNPPALEGAALAYDSLHGIALLYGGAGPGGFSEQLWQWDGVTWTELNTLVLTGGGEGIGGAYLPSAQQFYAFGGYEGVFLGDTWILTSPFIADYSSQFSGAIPTAFFGQPYSFTISFQVGGGGPYTFTDTGVPTGFSNAGLNLNSSGTISGTDTLPVNQSPIGIGVIITDGQGEGPIVPVTLVSDNPITFSPSAPPPDATVGTTYTGPFAAATGGTPPFTYSASSNLPAGLSISGTQITGQCSAPTSTNALYLTATDSLNGIATAGPFTLNCNPAPQITNSATLPGAYAGSNYSVQLTTNAIYDSPGASPYSWSAPANSLPQGLNLGTTTGQITGIPVGTGTTMFTVTFKDVWGASAQEQFQITVFPPLSITTTQLASGTIGFGYPAGQAIVATGGDPPYTFGATGLPPGLSINHTSGAITGSPTAVGAYTPTFTITDSNSVQISLQIPISVFNPGTNPEDWVQLSPAFSPQYRFSASTFYDTVRGKLILFGGSFGSEPLNDTESWDGTNWTTVTVPPTSTPSARLGAAAAFDPVHQQGVMFGGVGPSNSLLSDTWLWNGTTWTLANTSSQPPGGRYDAMMAWDGQHIVLYGGRNLQNELADTWIWDGANWSNVTPTNSPYQRDLAGMAYDSVRNKVVMFGGFSFQTNGDVAETWIWDGTAMTWTQLTPSNPPQARDSLSLAFDSIRGETILYGGYVSSSNTYLPDTWEWDGAKWTPLTTAHSPGPRDFYAMAFDAGQANMVLFGGTNPASSSFYLNDTWILEGPYITSSATLPSGIMATPYSDTPTVAGGLAPLTFTDSSAPSWLAINGTTGALTGTPPATGTFPFNDIVIDSFGVSSTANLSLTVSGPSSPLTLLTTTLPNATAGANYLVQLSATGGVGSYVFAASGLPAGLQLNGNQIVGQCTASSSTVTLSVSDSEPKTVGVGPLTVTCNAALQITTQSLGNAVVSEPISVAIQTTGGTAPITWSLTPGNLPAGFQLSSAGVLTGTPTSTTTLQFSITASDIWSDSVTQPYNVSVYPVLTVTSTSLPSGVQGVSYPSGVVLGVTGGTGSTTYDITATGLPPQLVVDPSTGLIHGIPTQAGIFTPTFTVTDGTPQTTLKQIPIEILAASGNPNWTNLNPAGPPLARDSYAMAFDPVHAVTVLYGGLNNGDTWTFRFPSTWTKQTPTASPQAQLGPAMAWMVSQNNAVLFGGLNGATLSQTWVWDGTNWTNKSPGNTPPPRYYHGMAPDSAHNRVVMFGGSSGGNYTNALADTWVWDGTNWNATSPTNIPPAAYGPSLADGPTGPVLFGGLNTSGNPLNQTYVWDGANWNLQAPLISPPARALAGMVYDSQSGVTILFGGLSGTTQLQDTWQWDGHQWTQLNPATLPTPRNSIGLAYDSAFNQVIVFGGQSAPELADTWTFGGPTVVNTTLPTAAAGAAYNGAISVIGGSPPYSYTQTGNPQSLPAGLNLNLATGQITGATTSVGTYTVGIAVEDSQTVTTTPNFSLTVNSATSLTPVPPTLPNATAATNYNVQLSAVGGNPPYSFSVANLPAGLQLNSNNQIAGQCTAASANASYTVTDSSLPTPFTVSVTGQSIQCNALPTITTPSPLPSGDAGTPYSAGLQITGGTAPIAWLLNPGTLPSGFHLSSTGVLTGSPTAAVSAQFSVTVTDFWGASVTKPYTLVINPAVSITTASPLPAATIGTAYTQNLAASGGQSPYTWASANLPSWLGLSSAGALTGTPPANTPVSVTFNVTVTDSLGGSASGSFSLPVQSASSLLFQTTSPLPPATVNAPYSTTVVAVGGSGTYTFNATGLPSWLSLNNSTGLLSGTPPSAGPVTFQLTVTDSANHSLTQSFTLPVNAQLTIGTASPLPPATVGAPYAGTMAASGGSGTYTWSIGGEPSWLSLSTGGVFSGTPTAAGPVTFQITVQDTLNHSLTQTFTLPVDAALKINTASPLPAATANFPYMATFAASGGSGTYTWSQTGLPGVFTLTAAGVLTGTPQADTPIVFSVTLKDSLNNSLTASFTLPVNAALIINNSSPLPPATVQLPYSANFTASGGNPSYTWTATGLPSWLSLTTAGYLSGTPPAGATEVSFQVTVTDSAAHSVTATFTLPVTSPLTIITASLPLATVNVVYSQTLTATGGDGTYSWSASGLPSGLSMSAAGVLSGSVSVAGPYPFQVTVNDTQKATASKNFTLLVSTGLPLSYVTQNLTACVVYTSCSNQIVAAGGIPPYTFSLASTANLDGFTISASGLLSGTPQSAGAISIPVVLTDQQSSLPRTFTETVHASLAVNTSSLAGGTVGVSYGAGLSASGGQPPYNWSLASGSLPPGLSLDPQGGDIYGTPLTAGTYPFSVQVTDGVQTSQPRPLSIAIAAPSIPAPLTIVTASQLAPATVATAYSQTLAATGGSGQYSWALTSGSLPAGLSLGLSGAITGTPTTAQTANFRASVGDTSGNSVSAGFTIVVTSATSVGLLTPNPLPNGVVGVMYNYGIQVTGGKPPYFYSISAGQVPPGLTFDETSGALNGTPTQRGSFGIVLNVTDSGGTAGVGQTGSLAARQATARAIASSNYTIQIAGVGDFQIASGENLPDGTLGQKYSTTLTASGGQAPYQWQLLNGTLPTGLALASGGTISGTPTAAGTVSLVIKVTDNTGASATGAFLLQIVNPNVPVINAAPPLPPGTVGAGYSSVLTAAGGHSPYTWTVSTGSLPPGISLDAQSGTLSGTPGKAGNFPFTAEVTDSNRVTSTQSFAIRVNSLTLQITPASIPNGVANLPYSFALSAAGGTAPYNWSLSAGGLLSSFAIDPATGAITGTPTAPGVYEFTISVVDSNFGLATQNYQFTVESNNISISTTSVPSATVGVAYDFGLLAANSTPPLTWTVTSGNLPPGIQLMASSGLLVGTPTAAGNYTFTAQVTDQTTATAQATFTLQVSPPPLTIVTASLPGGAVGTGYSQTLQATGGTGTITWSVTSGTLPAGLSLGAATGIISGTPTAFGSFTITVEATDSKGVTAQQTITLNLAGPPAAPAITLSGLPATSKPGDQPTVTITLASPYSLPIVVTATLSLTPSPGNSTDLMFANGLRTTQLIIPANATTATLPFQTGTLPGTIQLSLALTAVGVNITPAVAPAATTTIAATAPTIGSVSVATTAGGLQVTVVGTSTTLDMQTATFQFTPAAGANLQTSSVSVNVSSLFAAWYKNPASLATGSQFSLTEPFTISGNVSSIASVTVTLTNSVGASAPASANVP
jgi:hypothetical protein